MTLVNYLGFARTRQLYQYLPRISSCEWQSAKQSSIASAQTTRHTARDAKSSQWNNQQRQKVIEFDLYRAKILLGKVKVRHSKRMLIGCPQSRCKPPIKIDQRVIAHWL